MVDIINKFTGFVMQVAEDRVNEYLEAGHKLASSNEEKEEKPVKRSRKKKEV